MSWCSSRKFTQCNGMLSSTTSLFLEIDFNTTATLCAERKQVPWLKSLEEQ